MAAPSPIRVLCVDDVHDVTVAMRLVIDAEPDMECVGCLGSADHLIEEVRRVGADVVLLDAKMPGKSAFEAMTELSSELPRVNTIIYSGYDDRAHVDRALDAGARGFVSKNVPPQAILQAVREVVAGKHSFLLRQGDDLGS